MGGFFESLVFQEVESMFYIFFPEIMALIPSLAQIPSLLLAHLEGGPNPHP